MPHVICPSCHVQYNAAGGRCPNCGARRPAVWQPLLDRRWPVALAIGVVLEAVAMRYGPATLAPQVHAPLVVASWFLAGTLVFTVLAGLVLLAVSGVLRDVRRRRRRSARRKLARKRM
ncbi:hypothetical protein [Lichenicoccus roseus]|uniref:Uncharacterized protein n=1 Tax=Lichenicoccus roseus TaxID=2683649 RepID=A0A5R9J9D8_9PROT|nr:hypothetical protein [Lichenicoccus roseus]TLU72211.1 hypothetical protein FE263_13970 [Lichenicoccus roseus]